MILKPSIRRMRTIVVVTGSAFLPPDFAFRDFVRQLTGKSYASEKDVFNALVGRAGVDTIEKVLLYHVVPGRVTAADVVKLTSAKTAEGRSLGIKVVNGSVFVDGAQVTTPDVEATNGVIHVIDSVLIPKEATAPKTIVQTAVAAGSFKTLASLLKKAGLVGTLQGKGPFTVFAPTDAAFAKLPKATLAALAKNKAKLRSVLLYHVVKGNVSAAKVVTLRSAKTLNGKAVSIRVNGGNVLVGGARVTTADVKARQLDHSSFDASFGMLDIYTDRSY